jgi:hypothetical protein
MISLHPEEHHPPKSDAKLLQMFERDKHINELLQRKRLWNINITMLFITFA